jgi:hypothetical protein
MPDLRLPLRAELLEAREHAEIFVALAAIEILVAVLLAEHAALHEPDDVPIRAAARRLLDRARDLDAELRRYRDVLRADAEAARQEALPF